MNASAKKEIRIQLKSSRHFDLNELNKINFGHLEGEKDVKLNSDTLYPTQSIQLLLVKNYNYILSPKGVGKSAIFSGLVNKYISKNFFKYDKHSIIPINKAFGNDNEFLNPEKFGNTGSRKTYAIYWGLYIMSELLSDIFKNHSNRSH